MLLVGIEPHGTFFMTVLIYRDQEVVEYSVVPILGDGWDRVVAEVCLTNLQADGIPQIYKIVFMYASDQFIFLSAVCRFGLSIKGVGQNDYIVGFFRRNNHNGIVAHRKPFPDVD